MSIYDQIFANGLHGNADDPSPAGFVQLALLGKDAWNAWREAYPTQKDPESGKWRRNFRLRDQAIGADLHPQNFPTLNFEGFNFGDAADFTSRQFPGDRTACFKSAVFGDDTTFAESAFHGGVTFEFAQFGSNANLRAITIVGRVGPGNDPKNWANFSSTVFGKNASLVKWVLHSPKAGEPFGPVNFDNCNVGSEFSFEISQVGNSGKVHLHLSQAEIGNDARFLPANGVQYSIELYKSTFLGAVTFEGITFKKIDVLNTQFRGDTSFGGSPSGKEELGLVLFDGVKFLAVADFTNRKFMGRTVFKRTSFRRPPLFHNSELHQDTYFGEESFPTTSTGDVTDSSAYRTLKLAMSKYQATNYEQFFFRKEMAEEQREHFLAGRYLLWALYFAYRSLSNFGASVWRPVVGYVVAVLLFAGVYALLAGSRESMWFGPNMAIDFTRTTDWIGYSLLSSLPISGLDDMAKGIMRQLLNASQWTPPAILGIALVLHKVLSVLLLFLVGLALRNHFKLK